MEGIPLLVKPKSVLLIGGGKVALQKAQVLFENNINTTIITKTILPEFDSIDFPKVIKKFKEKDLHNFDIVIDATGDKELAKDLYSKRKTLGYLFNAVDIPELCDFYFASLLKYRDLKIMVSSNGASPTLTQVARDTIKTVLPKSLGDLNEELAIQRSQGVIDPKKAKEKALKKVKKAYLVGCGVGDKELLTVKALRLITSVDVVLFDHLISEEILGLIPKSTQKVYVGKKKGCHRFTQEEINATIIDYLSKNKSVARLKSGDPFVFGRGSEEAEDILKFGFEVEVVPGISSAISAPASGGIPVTARDYATSFSVVTAHMKGSRFNTDWLELLKIKNHTVIVLMGLSFAKEIKQALLEQGIGKDMPVAIISNASRENQKVVTGKLKKLSKMAKTMESPAVLVFGDVVKLSRKLYGC